MILLFAILIFLGLLGIAVGCVSIEDNATFALSAIVISIVVIIFSIKGIVYTTTQKLQQEVINKNYQVETFIVDGVHKNRVESKATSYFVKSQYSEVTLPELKPDDIVKVTYVQYGFSNNYIISIEKIK